MAVPVLLTYRQDAGGNRLSKEYDAVNYLGRKAGAF